MERWAGSGSRRLGLRRLISLLTLLTAISVVWLFGCREEIGTELDRNLAPDTYLTGAPAESSTTVYLVHLFWQGNDPDGKVAGYEYAVTDSFPDDEDSLGYAYTTRTDSIFRFSVGSNQQVLGHRFYVRAVDNEGEVDPEPAWTFFGVVDLVPPTPVIRLAEAWRPGTEERMTIVSTSEVQPDTVPAGWNVRFAWTGLDGDRVIDENGEIFTVGEVVQYAWQLVGRDVTSTIGGQADTTVAYTDLRDQKYLFTLRAVDDAGFAGLDPAKRSFVWNRDPQTYFQKGVTPGGELQPHFFAFSDAWAEREFFDGDTVPLSGSPAGPRPVNIRAVVGGTDSDPIAPQQISGFQYRPGEGVWQNMADSVIVLGNRQTANYFLQARATDGLGRRDGTPAVLRIYVNRAPELLDTLGYAGGEPVLQYPRADEEIRLETILIQNGALDLRFRAEDPDSTSTRFEYQWRTTGFLYEPTTPIRPPQDGIATYRLILPPAWQTPGTYELGVKIGERVTGQDFQRTREVAVRFHIIA